MFQTELQKCFQSERGEGLFWNHTSWQTIPD